MKIGQYEVYLLEVGQFVLDGGSIFGLVPKVLWNKQVACDDRNRIILTVKSLLIIGQKRIILVDTGFGNIYQEKL